MLLLIAQWAFSLMQRVFSGVVLIFFLVVVFIGVELISFFDGVLILEDILE